MRYVSATVNYYSRVKTKADLKRAVAAINAGEPNSEVDIETARGEAGLSELREDVTLLLTNGKRSWNASVWRQVAEPHKLMVR